MRLKLSGPDYKGGFMWCSFLTVDMDSVAALRDFRLRVANYEKAYEPIGDYEEALDNVQYCKVRLFFPILKR
jgi:6-phosphofructo-2-kinase